MPPAFLGFYLFQELFPRREEVERSNTSRLSNLRTDEMTFNAIDGELIPQVWLRSITSVNR